jgi:hypothetical protein
MPYKRPSRRRPSWIRAPLIILGLLYLLAFWTSIRGLFEFLWNILLLFLGAPNVDLSGSGRHLSILFFTIFIGFLAIFFLWLYLISAQALLPVKKFRKDWGAARRSEQQSRRARTVTHTTPRTAFGREYPGWRRQPAAQNAPEFNPPLKLAILLKNCAPHGTCCCISCACMGMRCLCETDRFTLRSKNSNGMALE